MGPAIDPLDQELLNRLQSDFPICSRPWQALAEPLGLDEAAVLTRLAELKRRRILREISAIFDSKALGYSSALVAAQAAPEALEACAARVSAHPGVSHNYQREHAFNLWFTLAVAPGRQLQAEVDALGRAAGLNRWQAMPALRTFRIGVRFDMRSGQAQASGVAPASKPKARVPLEEADRARVRCLQEDLALISQPFAPMAQSLSVDEAALFAWMAQAQTHGWLRRYAGVLRHREAGFGEGGMGVWETPEARAAELGQAFAEDPAVTHCYERATFDGWPYRLFTMVHGADRAACLGILDAMGRRVPGWTDRAVLFSTKEFKKERVKYFLEPGQVPART